MEQHPQKTLQMTIHDINDTICAISTPPGIGGIAVIRISGPDAIATADKIWHGRPLAQAPGQTLRYGTVDAPDGTRLDDAVAAIYRAPHSYTGQDTVEISVHGSTYIQHTLLQSLTAAGARLAAPGEYTRRALAAGKLDLPQAEAVADIIAARSRAEHRIAATQMRGGYSARLRTLRDTLIDIASLLELELDFSEEDVQFADRADLLNRATQLRDEITRLEHTFATGNAIRQGIPTAIVGHTNAGKSSLLNALLNDDRAIVSDIHGTTRDIIEDTATIGDYTIRFIDTAGIRDTSDTIEQLGIQRSRRAIGTARILILVLDPTSPTLDTDTIPAGTGATPIDTHLIIAINKTDIAPSSTISDTPHFRHYQRTLQSIYRTVDTIGISAATGQGLDTLREAILRAAGQGLDHSDIIVTNERHRQALADALPPLDAVIAALAPGSPVTGDLIAQDLRTVISTLSTIIGDITTPDLLTTIFSRFCIGK